MERRIFIERLRWKRHSHWNWKRWWRRDFNRIRGDFRHRDRDRDFRRFRRDRDRRHDHDGDRQMIIRKDTDMRKGRDRDRIIDRTPDRRDRDGDRQMIIKKGKDSHQERVFDRVRDRFQGDKTRFGDRDLKREGSDNRRMTIKKDLRSSTVGDTKREFHRHNVDRDKTSASSSSGTGRISRKKLVDDENKTNPQKQ